MDASGTVDSSRAPQLVVADVGIISPPPANNPRRGQSRTVTAQALAAPVRRLFRRQEPPPPPSPRLPPGERGRQQTARMTPDEVSAEFDRIAATFEGHGDPPDFRDDDTRMGLIWEPPRRRRTHETPDG